MFQVCEEHPKLTTSSVFVNLPRRMAKSLPTSPNSLAVSFTIHHSISKLWVIVDTVSLQGDWYEGMILNGAKTASLFAIQVKTSRLSEGQVKVPVVVAYLTQGMVTQQKSLVRIDSFLVQMTTCIGLVYRSDVQILWIYDVWWHPDSRPVGGG